MHSSIGIRLSQVIASTVIDVETATAIATRLCALPPAELPPAASQLFTLDDVFVHRSGDVTLSDGFVPTVRGVVDLLGTLLAEVRRHGPARFPRELVVLGARATGRMDAPPSLSLEGLAAALARFAPADPAAVVAGLAVTAATPEPVKAVAAADAGADAHDEPAAEIELFRDDEYETASADPASAAPGRPAFADRLGAGERRSRRSWRAAAVAAMLAGGAVAAGFVLSPDVARLRPAESTDVVVSTHGTTGLVPAGPPADRSTSKTDTAPAPVPPAMGGSDGSAARAGTAQPATARPLPPPPVTTPTADDIPVATAGATPRPLIDEEEVDAEKVFSPSFESGGTAVFFHAETAAGSALKRAERGENGVLHVATIADDKAKNYHVRLSPDGRAIAFDSDRDGVRGIYVARADGTDVRRVTGDGFAAVPSWSPDGGRLAFLRDEPGRPDVWNLWTLDLASGATVRHTNHRYGQVWGGAWFPDGRRLAYSHEDRLLILDLVSGRTTRYDSPRKGRLVRTPAVSPDGRWIIFQVHRDGGWLLEVANGEMRRILDDASAEEFAWSPDGRQVAFHSRRSGQWSLWQMASR